MNDRAAAEARVARAMWTIFEPIHAVTYFSPESRGAYESIGLRGFWRGYFAGRAAPLGQVGPAPVTAAFFGFAPQMVGRAVPQVWETASPEQVLQARRAGALAALERLVAGQIPDIAEALHLVETATGALDHGGRVLAAANAALPEPEEPLARLWMATTILREHRGDGHVAALVASGLTGCQTLRWRASVDLTREILQPNRGWTDEQWDAAAARLTERGWLDATGAPLPAGAAAFQEIEFATDRAAAQPWRRLGETGTRRLHTLLAPAALTCYAAMPTLTPIGLPPPATAL